MHGKYVNLVEQKLELDLDSAFKRIINEMETIEVIDEDTDDFIRASSELSKYPSTKRLAESLFLKSDIDVMDQNDLLDVLEDLMSKGFPGNLPLEYDIKNASAILKRIVLFTYTLFGDYLMSAEADVVEQVKKSKPKAAQNFINNFVGTFFKNIEKFFVINNEDGETTNEGAMKTLKDSDKIKKAVKEKSLDGIKNSEKVKKALTRAP